MDSKVVISKEDLKLLTETLKSQNGIWVTYSKDASEFDYVPLSPGFDAPVLGLSLGNQDDGSYAIEKDYSLISDVSGDKTHDPFTEIGAIFFPKNFLNDEHSIPEDYEKAKKLAIYGIPCRKKAKKDSEGCLFLDRDGIIIEDKGYINNPKDCSFIEEIVPILEWARNPRWVMALASTGQSAFRPS